MLDLDLAGLASRLRSKSVSATQVARYFLDRAEKHQAVLNAFITLDPEKTLAEAAEAERLIADGRGTPLSGIPVAHKDIFCARGWPTTCGSRMLHNFVAPYDAHVVSRLRESGAVSLGKTNMDEFAMGSSSESSWYGPVRNPWRTTAVPGGSSGGSAAAVAAGLAPAATATDTGGSIRQPAAMCGISGLKPTYGVVSRYGMIAYASSLDQGGPMARSAADLATLLNAMAGFDARDSTSLARDAEDYGRSLDAPLDGLRVGLPNEWFGDGLDAGVRQVVETALDKLRGLGARTVPVDLPNTRLAIPAYYVIAPAEASSNLSRFDGVRYGHRAEGYADLDDLYRRTRAEGFGAEVRRRILIGTYVLSHGYYDAYYLKAQRVRRLVADDFARAFERCDVIAGPTAPTSAFEIGAKSQDPVQMYLSDIYTLGVNLAGLPGMSIPAGFDAGAMPVGLHLVGNYFSEARLLNVAHRFQTATDWHLRVPPGYGD